MDLYAILSDIHANYEALSAVEDDARAESARLGTLPTFICLGDIVDYGPSPVECLRWVRQHCALTIQGNHDRVVAQPMITPIQSISPDIWPITLWTKCMLSSRQRNWLRNLPATTTVHAVELFTLFHSNLVKLDEGITGTHDARPNLERLETSYGLFGHTHYPGLFRLYRKPGKDYHSVEMGLACDRHEMPESRHVNQVALNVWHDLPHPIERTILNPGSVGQPRSHGALHIQSNHATYLLIAPHLGRRGQYQFRRVPYNVESTLRRLREDVVWDRSWPTERWQKRSRDPNLADTFAKIDQLLASLLGTLVAQLSLDTEYQPAIGG
jgi:predicted phosphodiesterase